MANIGDGQFRSTLNALWGCYDNMGDSLRAEEDDARKKLIVLCAAIAADYGYTVVRNTKKED